MGKGASVSSSAQRAIFESPGRGWLANGYLDRMCYDSSVTSSKKRRASPKAKPATSRAVAKSKPLSPRVQSSIDAHHARRAKRKPAPSWKVTEKDGVPEIKVDHPDEGLGQLLVMEALGTADPDFMAHLLCQLASATKGDDKVDERSLNFMVSVIKGVEPRDQVEAMLAAQMAAVHNASMTFARRLNHIENIAQQDSAANAFNKLTRTFVAQVEGLKRYRSKGEQKVIVEHVTVNAGGQAVVGHVTAGGRGAGGNPEPTA